MKKTLILIGTVLIACFLMGCANTIQKEQAHSLQEYIGMSNSGDNVYVMDIAVKAGDEKIGAVSENYRHNDFLKQIVYANNAEILGFYGDTRSVICYEGFASVLCIKFVENATNFMKNGIGFDDRLPGNSEIQFLGVERHDGVETDCFRVIPRTSYLDNVFSDLAEFYGRFDRGNMKMCYGRNDGMMRYIEGELFMSSKLTQKEMTASLIVKNRLIRSSNANDISSPVPFAIGDVDCSKSETVSVELVSLAEDPELIFTGTILNSRNKVEQLGTFMKMEKIILDVEDSQGFERAYTRETPLGSVCDVTGEYCLNIICD